MMLFGKPNESQDEISRSAPNFVVGLGLTSCVAQIKNYTGKP
jgi:hypothetical protein